MEPKHNQHEQALRLETEGLQKVLRVLQEVKDRQTLFDRLAVVLRELLPFDAGCIVLQEDGGFRISRATSPTYLNQTWADCDMLRRLVAGEIILLPDTVAADDWLACAPQVLSEARSVLLAPVRSKTITAIIIFMHNTPDTFTTEHRDMVRRFTPMLNHVLSNVEVYERLQRDHEAIQQAAQDRLNALEDLRKADEEVHRIRKLMSSAISFAPIYLWEIDENGVYSFVEGSEKVLGWKPEEIVGRTAFGFLEEIQIADPGLWKERFHGRSAFENVIAERCHKGGQTVWVSVSGSPIVDEHGAFKGFRGVTTDVTEAIRANLKLAKMALHDSLTGLANRRKFLTFFENEEARLRRNHKPLSLLALDLDCFRQINDEFGHPAGDDVLGAVAMVLKGMTRKTDLVARFGGGQFMILLPETCAVGAFDVAEKMRKTLAAEVISAQCGDTRVQVRITASIGVASISPDQQSVSFDELMAYADRALYTAKHNGRDQVCLAVECLSDPNALEARHVNFSTEGPRQ